MAPMSTDLPAPVSPVTTLRPGPKAMSADSTTATSWTVSFSIMAGCVELAGGYW